MDNKRYEILTLLSSDSYQTSQEIATKLGISEKTVRTRIKELNLSLKDYGAQVESKRHFGFRLVIEDEQSFLTVSRTKDLEIPETSEQRHDYLLNLLLNAQGYLKLDDIAEQVYVSRNTLSATLKRVEAILTEYHLKIDRKPNHGVKVLGDEFDKRTCLVNNLYQFYADEEKSQWLMKLIMTGNQEYKVSMSEIALENFIKYVLVSLNRLKHGYRLARDDRKGDEVSKATKRIVDGYCQEIEQAFNLQLSREERQFLSIHFGSRLSSDSYSRYGPNFVISGKIDELVFQMLMRVYETFTLDFRNNLELRMSLNQHLVPMDIRLRYNIPATNPLLDMIKQEYPYPYTLAATACTSLKEYYNRDIPEDEISYIAIIFALATEKRDRKIEKKNIVLVCVSGKSSSQLFKFKYRQAFGDYINDIYECTLTELDDFDFKGHDIHYIFTTVPLNKKYIVPIYEINLFIDVNDILTYRQMFESGDHSAMLDYYSTNLFIPNLKADTREEVIELMCQRIDHYGLLPEGFYDAVMKREELGQTDFGNLVALPHPYKVLSEQSFATVAVLDKPIMWKNNLVQVVFLLSVGSQEDSQLETFYQKTSNLFFDEQAIKKLIAKPTFETLVEILM